MPAALTETDAARVVVEGVGFWDDDHGQAGVAPNAIELHPVLSFRGRAPRLKEASPIPR
jgi:hypothetical protein